VSASTAMTVSTPGGFISASHRAATPFELHRPTTIDEAAALLAGGAVAHAGGIDFVAGIRDGNRPQAVAHLGDIDELRRIEVVGEILRIGAGATHHQIESDPLVTDHRPDLQAAWATVGNVRIRRAGTVGGNLLAFDATYDAAPILAVAGAVLVWADGSRCSVVDRSSSNGLLVAVEVPVAGTVLFDRSLKPTVTVALGEAGVAIGCAYPEVLVLNRPSMPDDIDAWNLPEPTGDAFASATYRARMVKVLAKRLLAGSKTS
jgi:CO/xanthine dehydrogenase FAD-binding subunit